MGPVRQNTFQGTVRSVHVCALHCAQLLHTILHRTDLIIFPLTLQTIITAPMMSIWEKGDLIRKTINTLYADWSQPFIVNSATALYTLGSIALLTIYTYWHHHHH